MTYIVPNVEKQHKHDITSEELDAQIQAFLASGGKIQHIETGLSGEDLRAVPCGQGRDGSRYKYVNAKKLQLTIKRGG